jgi:hypothetical protein
VTLAAPVPVVEPDSDRPDWMGDPGPPSTPLPPRVPEVDAFEGDTWEPPGGSYRNVTWSPNWRPASHF